VNVRHRGILFLAAALTAFATAAFVPALRIVSAGVGLACFLLSASAFSIAGQTAGKMQPFRGRLATVDVWGAPLPDQQSNVFRIDSIAGLGAGLLIHLSAGPGGSRTLLKIAQPSEAQVTTGSRLEIGKAAYVQWAGRRIKRAPGVEAPALVLELVQTAPPSGSSSMG
jgi:hypothetical protein